VLEVRKKSRSKRIEQKAAWSALLHRTNDVILLLLLQVKSNQHTHTRAFSQGRSMQTREDRQEIRTCNFQVLDAYLFPLRLSGNAIVKIGSPRNGIHRRLPVHWFRLRFGAFIRVGTLPVTTATTVIAARVSPRRSLIRTRRRDRRVISSQSLFFRLLLRSLLLLVLIFCHGRAPEA
jgi:hypothetical protein